VQAGDGPGKTECHAQERPQRHWLAEQPFQELTTRVFQHQHGPAALLPKRQRPCRPGPVQRVLQGIFMDEAIEAGRCRMGRGGQHGEHGAATAIGVTAPSAAEDAIAVVPHDLEFVVPFSGELRR
jgi:hypothetical protein